MSSKRLPRVSLTRSVQRATLWLSGTICATPPPASPPRSFAGQRPAVRTSQTLGSARRTSPISRLERGTPPPRCLQRRTTPPRTTASSFREQARKESAWTRDSRQFAIAPRRIWNPESRPSQYPGSPRPTTSLPSTRHTCERSSTCRPFDH